LIFTATAHIPALGKKMDTPELPDLAQTLRFQRRLRAAESVKKLDSIKKQVEKEAAQEQKQRCIAEKRLLALALQEVQKRTTRSGRVLKKPASTQSLATVFNARQAVFKPLRRVRAKSSPALLAILQDPHNSRHTIVGKALAWITMPELGNQQPPLALQERPFFKSPAKLAAPSTPRGNGQSLPCASPSPRRARTDSPLRCATPGPNADAFSPRRPCASPRATPRGSPGPCASPVPRSAPHVLSPEPVVSNASGSAGWNPSLAASPRAWEPTPLTAGKQRWPCASPEPKGAPRAFSPAPYAVRGSLLQSP